MKRAWVIGDMTRFIAGLPKVELHVHHVGSASPRIVAELAERHAGSTTVPSDLDALKTFYEFRDFDHFIEVYLAVADLIRDPEDLRLLIYEVGRELGRQHVRYAEVTITPYTHSSAGMAPEAICEAIEDARIASERDHGVVMRWCFDIPGESGLPAADATLEIAVGLQPAGLVSFGLGGPEFGVPRAQFKPHFDAALAVGLRSVPHAGESTGPETIWAAVQSLGADRIGHGIRAIEDPALVEHLIEHQIPLEVCPTSNLRTRVVPDFAHHPLPAMVAAGLVVTINSDDPPMFGTTLNREYEVATDLLALDENGVAALVKSAIDASFLDNAARRVLHLEVDDYLRDAQNSA